MVIIELAAILFSKELGDDPVHGDLVIIFKGTLSVY